MLNTAVTLEPEYLTTGHVARLLQIAENTVRLMATRGELPYTRAGSVRLYRREDVERLRAARASR